MGHDVVLVVGVIVIIAALSFLAVLVITLKGRRKLFAGPARDAWERARRALAFGDQLEVWSATMRRRPVDQAALASGQLAYIRYAQHVAERSPLRRWPLRTAVCLICGGNAALLFAMAATETQLRSLRLVAGVAFAVLAVTYGPLISRLLRRQPARLRQLRAQVMERYPDVGVTGPPQR